MLTKCPILSYEGIDKKLLRSVEVTRIELLCKQISIKEMGHVIQNSP